MNSNIAKLNLLLLSWFCGCQYLFAALPVTNGLVIHLDAGSVSGVSEGGTVAEWSDLSGLGNDAAQVTSTNQPVYDVSNPSFNDLPTVHFDGTNDFFNLPSGSDCPINVGSFTVFITAQFSDLTSTWQDLCSGQGTDGGDDRLRIQIAGLLNWRAGSSGYQAIQGGTPDTDVHVFGMTSDVEGFLDGVSVGTASNSSILQPSGFVMGAEAAGTGGFLNGDIAEFIVYNRVLNATEIAQVNDYLTAKYSSQPLSAPTGLVAAAGDGSVSLDWNDNTEPDFAGYNIYRDDTSGEPYTQTQIAMGVTTSDYVDNSVVNGKTYYYVITAIDTSNEESGYSNEASASPQGPAPITTRYMENLDRGVVAVRTSATDVFISWRVLGLDPSDIGFNLYRSENGGAAVKLNGSVLTGGTNYMDTTANLSASNDYFVKPVIDGVQQPASVTWTLPANSEIGPLFRIPLQPPHDRVVKFVWVGDADGDGEYEFFVSFKGSTTGQTQKLQAYKRDGTFLWEVDFGPNSVDPDGVYPNAAAIAAGQWDGVTVYDLDSDGFTEVIVKSANGVTFGDGTTLSYGDDVTQFISVLDGMTGVEKARTLLPNPWINDNNYPLGVLFGIGYPDGQRPSLMIHAKNRAGGGGTPFNIINSAWDYRDGTIRLRWSIQWGANDPDKGESSHQMRIVDLDQDGTDELIPGMHAINSDGTLRWNLGDQGVVHGDRFHIGDLNPNRSGLEMYGIQQNNPNGLIEYFADASSGELLWDYSVSESGWDAARGSAADIDPRYPGMEVWSFNGVRSSTGTVISQTQPYPNLQIWWDGDLLAENLHDEIVEKWDYINEWTSRLLNADNYGSLDGARDVPAFYGDILGDWREEIIYGHWELDELLVFTTPYPTDTRLYTLAHNPAYRNCMTAKGYYQSNQLDYFLGDGMSTPPTPDISLVVPKFNPADIVQDGSVDFYDFSVLAAQWMDSPGIPSADIAPLYGDGIVDELDLQVLCENWLSVEEE